ncbi:MAG: hypothetical protein B0W54_17375 [Cellvibrio sp. 79]|nr:MAG: hypothetical protein B0W54_17375 [Cellvibrio sp. 79]
MDVRKLLVFILLATSLNSTAEIYRWVDKNGKVHFTDKKPSTEAENITKDVKTQNIDTSNGEIQKIAAMRELEEKNRQEQLQQEQTRQREHKEKLAELNQSNCEQARKRLVDISGYVVFTDEQRRAINVTEKERQQMVAELKQDIQTYCSP